MTDRDGTDGIRPDAYDPADDGADDPVDDGPVDDDPVDDDQDERADQPGGALSPGSTATGRPTGRD